MEGEGLTHDGIPGQVVRRLGEVGAFVAVCADLLAAVDLEIREEAADEGTRHLSRPPFMHLRKG